MVYVFYLVNEQRKILEIISEQITYKPYILPAFRRLNSLLIVLGLRPNSLAIVLMLFFAL